MTLCDNPDELCIRYLPGYTNERTGEIQFLSPTACSKIAAHMACKMLGKKVAVTADHNTSLTRTNLWPI